MMKELFIGFDDNLGLPDNFAQYTGLSLRSYHELDDMIRDFENKKLSLMFIPCGTLPYLEQPFSIVSQATLGPNHDNRIHVQLMTAKDLSLEESAHKVFGRINPYCTTSYWGLLIFLMEKFPAGTTINFRRVAGFQDLLDKTAQKVVERGMLWDKVLDKNPSTSSILTQLGEQSDLPTPLIIANTPIPDSLSYCLTHFQFDENNGFFNGFKAPDLKLIETFQQQMEKAQNHFLINELDDK
jgi:hypothetical protein